MKYNVAIVLAGNIEDSPYFHYYTDIFDKLNINYDIFSWDRLSIGPNGDYCFKYPSPDNLPILKKFYHYSLYSAFVKKNIIPSKYDFVIVFTIVNAIYLESFLIRNFRNRYIFDIRDYSPMYPYIKIKLKKIIENARQTYISSPGFKEWLPENFNYIISHNVRSQDILIDKKPKQIQNKQLLTISTFGIIRDYKTNKRLLNYLRYSDRFILEYNGWGVVPLQEYAGRNNITNARFGGRYKKEEENHLIEQADLINIIFSRTIKHDTAMTNRFYHAVINRKPMI